MSIFDEAGSAKVIGPCGVSTIFSIITPLGNSMRSSSYKFNNMDAYAEPTTRDNVPRNSPAMMMAMIITENHPGAFIAAKSILDESDEDTAKSIFLKLDDMNLRGKQLAFAYHSFSAGFACDLINSVNDKEKAMIDACNDPERITSHWWVVPSGATKQRLTREDGIKGIAAMNVSKPDNGTRDSNATKGKFKEYRDRIKGTKDDSNKTEKYVVADTDPATVGAHLRQPSKSAEAPDDLSVRDLDAE